MSEKRCERTELLVEDCAHCRPKKPTFAALYPGHCGTCPQPIEVGDLIRERPDGRYEHAHH